MGEEGESRVLQEIRRMGDELGKLSTTVAVLAEQYKTACQSLAVAQTDIGMLASRVQLIEVQHATCKASIPERLPERLQSLEGAGRQSEKNWDRVAAIVMFIITTVLGALLAIAMANGGRL